MSLLNNLSIKEATLLSMQAFLLLEGIQVGYVPTSEQVVWLLHMSAHTRMRACLEDPSYQDYLEDHRREGELYKKARDLSFQYPQSKEIEESYRLASLAYTGTFSPFLQGYPLLLDMLDSYLDYLSSSLMFWRQLQDQGRDQEKPLPAYHWKRTTSLEIFFTEEGNTGEDHGTTP